jgi:hypothetical protein
MSESRPNPDERPAEPDQDAGVLGNLPHTRPSVRSPRRKAPKAEAAEPSAPEAPQPQEAEGADASPADLEALARTGIAIAGGAATLGLRVAGRAAAALRDAVERR